MNKNTSLIDEAIYLGDQFTKIGYYNKALDCYTIACQKLNNDTELYIDCANKLNSVKKILQTNKTHVKRYVLVVDNSN
ncbi:hypothetical protein [Urbanus proteus nucleopolyhedrovirus]|uniref:Uncharacterized protein n=1 Tax=Urbanus proteus nucleopolyhedrovirus TaxID=1675866 RepID=A0A162GU77_9ABAC|nr:hypothetical protein [Urbanus proteus nucleopolyhedrovirus]AKR17327.1 hypothetical protein [Urbanus proteus nucleopolyhedrovirus]